MKMENRGEEEERGRRRRRGDEEDHQVYVLGFPCPCSSFREAIEAVLKCLGLDSSSSFDPPQEETPPETERDSGTGSRIEGFSRRRRPGPPVSSGGGGQTN